MARPMVALNSNASLEKRKDYVRPRVKQDRPAYGVINDGFYDDKDKFWNPGEALYFDGEPSLNMVPLNKMGYDKIQQMLDMLDAFGEEKAKKEKRAFSPQARQAWSEDDMNEDFPTPDSVMGMKKDGQNDAIR